MALQRGIFVALIYVYPKEGLGRKTLKSWDEVMALMRTEGKKMAAMRHHILALRFHNPPVS